MAKSPTRSSGTNGNGSRNSGSGNNRSGTPVAPAKIVARPNTASGHAGMARDHARR
jgi:hypothetical protein